MEEWKAVAGWEGAYEVSSFGRVRSVDRTVLFSDGRVRKYTGRILSQYRDAFGYIKTTLKKNGQFYRAHIHVLVAEAFIGPRPLGEQVCHNDGDPSNNMKENLRYGSSKENHADTILHGRQPRGESHSATRITEEQAQAIRALKGRMRNKDVAALFGIARPTVCGIQSGHRWGHLSESAGQTA